MLHDFTKPFDNKYLYHYTNSSSALLFILPQKKLRLSPCYKTNDPREIP